MRRNSPTTQQLPMIAVLWVICVSILCVLPEVASSGETSSKILVINSDASVEKYRDAQEAFKEAIVQPVLEMNLGDPEWNLSDAEDVLYDEDPAAIYCIGSKAYALANKLAADKILVFSSIANWRRLPLTNKTYGVSNELHVGMEITLFRYVFPHLQKIGVIYSKTYEEWFLNAQKEAQDIGVALLGQKISKKQQTIPTLKKLLPRVDAFWLISDPEVMSAKEDLTAILTECDRQRIPVFSYHEAFADFGSILIVSVDDPTIGRQAASIVRDVLAGVQLTDDEKVQFPAGTRILLHLKKIREYGLPYNEDALGSITVIIE